MTKFMVEIEVAGAAFEDSGELAGLLRVLADKVEMQAIEGEVTHNAVYAVGPANESGWPISDSNGQRIGNAWIAEEVPEGGVIDVPSGVTVDELPMGGCATASEHYAHLEAGEQRCANERAER